jgi:hypothetical protein
MDHELQDQTGQETAAVASRPEVVPKANKFASTMKMIYQPLGFSKAYNFPLCKYLLALVKDSILTG